MNPLAHHMDFAEIYHPKSDGVNFHGLVGHMETKVPTKKTSSRSPEANASLISLFAEKPPSIFTSKQGNNPSLISPPSTSFDRAGEGSPYLRGKKPASPNTPTTMASFNNGGNYPGAPSFESLLIQNLMGRLHLRSPSLDTNSFLSQTLDDFLLQDDPLSLGRDSDESPLGGGGGRGRSLLAREEAKLEKEIVRVIRSGAALEALKPNSGQSVSIGDHNVCVGYHEEPGSEYRVWEWHGHVMLFDEEDGFCPEYVYGNYFERVPLSARSKEGGHDGGQEKKDAHSRLRELIGEEKEERGKEKKGAYSGLRELIADEAGSAGNGCQRVLHRNSLSNGLEK